MAYDIIDPVGSWRDDFRTAYLMTIITNLVISTNAKRGTPFKTISDFLIEWDSVEKEPEQQSLEVMKETLMAIAKRAGIKKKVIKPTAQKPGGLNE